MDDAAVVRPTADGRALLLTMDVITPIVDDARTFGAIAACNALSDVYAMGGRPEVALSFVGLPTEVLGDEVVAEVMAGMNEVCLRAGCAIVGGHSMKDAEPKCGLSVVGSVDADAIWSQALGRPGDALILSQPIGTGLIGQAVRQEQVGPEALAEATRHMTTLNDVAARVGRQVGAHAATDVTGFGLLGHLRHVVEASGLSAEIIASSVPLLPQARELAVAGVVPGGTRRNLAYAEVVTRFEGVEATDQLVLADAQTSGGLLLAVAADRANEAVAALRDGGLAEAAAIGSLREGPVEIVVR